MKILSVLIKYKDDNGRYKMVLLDNFISSGNKDNRLKLIKEIIKNLLEKC